MMFRWFEALPFLFSIALKLAANIFSETFTNTLLRSIPQDYRISQKQKETIAGMAIDANARSTFVVTMFVSILSAVIMAYEHEANGWALIAAFIFGLAGVIGTVKLFGQELGWLRVEVTKFRRSMRRATLLTFLLILVDLALLAIAVLSSIPALKF